MTEKDIEQHLRREVEALGGVCLKFVSPGNNGVPDRIIIAPDNLIVFVELKRPHGGRYSPLQNHWKELLIDLGCNYRRVHTVEEVETLVRELRGHAR